VLQIIASINDMLFLESVNFFSHKPINRNRGLIRSQKPNLFQKWKYPSIPRNKMKFYINMLKKVFFSSFEKTVKDFHTNEDVFVFSLKTLFVGFECLLELLVVNQCYRRHC